MSEIQIPVREVVLSGALDIPVGARGIVIFAHGSGSSRFSRRNRFVANRLQRAGLATLLFDLLTEREEAIDERSRRLRFDIGLLAGRLVAVTDWVSRNPESRGLLIGYFGASTGAGAALVAAARLSSGISAIVSRGGRPDLAGDFLSRVTAPTLLIVGGRDEPVIELNEEAKAKLISARTVMKIVPGATHLFEEPGALEQVAALAGAWFSTYLGGSKQPFEGLAPDDERVPRPPI